MTLHPEIQKKAQMEMDALTNGSRLPTIADRPSLNYLNCIVKEVIRWFTPAPISETHGTISLRVLLISCKDFPHVQDKNKEAIVDGLTIPPSCVILVNMW
jgi:hypothetical protein